MGYLATFLIFICLFLPGLGVQAEIFYYRDEKGALHGVDSPALIPMQYQEKTKSLGTIAPSGKVKLEREGNTLFVPVKIGSLQTILVLDTGAGKTVISKKIQNELKYPSQGKVAMHTAGGTVEGDELVLPEISVNGFSVEKLPVAALDIPNLAKGEGLLGYDFLSHFKITLDADSGTLVLEKK